VTAGTWELTALADIQFQLWMIGAEGMLPSGMTLPGFTSEELPAITVSPTARPLRPRI